ncbi:hypothetical protein J4Q44_G00316030 [Coregonus suidteri]|uniref:Uncharacterized protein n=1 Tax=Coregonus suidteri TaxID=861788 RepID=A0AAN8QIQ7_9TELE
MVFSPCGRTRGTSVAAGGSSHCPNNSAGPTSTASGWKRSCALWAKLSMTIATMFAGQLSTSERRRRQTRDMDHRLRKQGCHYTYRVGVEGQVRRATQVIIGYQSHKDTATKSGSTTKNMFVV